MKFDLSAVPFSRFGSYFAISQSAGSSPSQPSLHIRTVRNAHDGFSGTMVFDILPLDEDTVLPFEVQATPSHLHIVAGSGHADIVITSDNRVRIRAESIDLGLHFRGNLDSLSVLTRHEGAWEFNSFSHRNQFLVRPLSGSVKVVENRDRRMVYADLRRCDNTLTGEWTVEEFRAAPAEPPGDLPFDNVVAEVQAEVEHWLENAPKASPEHAEARCLAAYVNWSAVVAPSGHFHRPAMLMSKNWMINVWSWDHAFNALALASHDPVLAWDQFSLPFDAQDACGALPDTINDQAMTWNYTKPPVHGLMLNWLMHHSQVATTERLREIYAPLCRWTEFWFQHRDDDGDGMPQYNHGNDSGWDNSTMVRGGVPVEGPDLAAFLILQMETLAEIAKRQGVDEEAAAWSERAERLLTTMLEHCWNGNRFVAPRSGSHNAYESDSLIAFIPLILGMRLPAEIRERLIAGIREEGAFLTQFGLATEKLDSPFYVSDGYWRGPIWAPATFLLVQGLRACGEEEFADDIARRFCDLCAKSGFAENFDAITGKPLRDRAYTWTSSVFLLLAHDLCQG